MSNLRGDLVPWELRRARKAWQAGNLSGLVDGLIISEEQSLSLPHWTSVALKAILPADLAQEVGAQDGMPLPEALHERIAPPVRTYIHTYSTGRGRHARWFTKWLQDLRDDTVWNWVIDAREHNWQAKEEIEGLLKILPRCSDSERPAVRRYLEEQDNLEQVTSWPHPTRGAAEPNRIFVKVVQMLRDQGGPVLKPATARAAYLRVQKRMKTEPWRYYWGSYAKTVGRRLGLFI